MLGADGRSSCIDISNKYTSASLSPTAQFSCTIKGKRGFFCFVFFTVTVFRSFLPRVASPLLSFLILPPSFLCDFYFWDTVSADRWGSRGDGLDRMPCCEHVKRKKKKNPPLPLWRVLAGLPISSGDLGSKMSFPLRVCICSVTVLVLRGLLYA